MDIESLIDAGEPRRFQVLWPRVVGTTIAKQVEGVLSHCC